MLKKRLIFTLLISDSDFQLSRNFTLQKVGNLDWLYKCYNLQAITKSIDELIILNVARDPVSNRDKYFDVVTKLSKNCFMPIALGGGIQSMQDAYRCMDSGADKLVIGKILFTNPSLVRELVSIFGGQSITAAVDFTRKDSLRSIVIENAKTSVSFNFEEGLKHINSLGIGEMMLTSVERDGTGQGFDLEAYDIAGKIIDVPIIASGGVGKFIHFTEGLSHPQISAVSTANIFNFMVNGLIDARKYVTDNGIELAKWEMTNV